MGSIKNRNTPLLDWRESPAIQRLLESHMFTGAKVIEVNLTIRSAPSGGKTKKYAEVIYLLGDKIFRAELKLRDDRHWDTRSKNDKRKREGTKGSHFTASDLLGQEGIPSTEKIN